MLLLLILEASVPLHGAGLVSSVDEWQHGDELVDLVPMLVPANNPLLVVTQDVSLLKVSLELSTGASVCRDDRDPAVDLVHLPLARSSALGHLGFHGLDHGSIVVHISGWGTWASDLLLFHWSGESWSGQ